ncbi:MAG: LPS assembly lipoprotein LptE [Candidatus Omnitrophica bacterium]|nr:LPS assembly lipoprotein LptE [Candidatus Omnitrophota bacterium]
MRRKIVLYFASVILFFVAVGCGYTRRALILDRYRTIYIKPFVNKIEITYESDAARKYKIYRPYLETDITQALVDKFLFDGNLRPTKSEDADLILKGELIDFRKDPLRYDANDEVEEYRINIVVNLKLWDNKENKLLWEESNFTGDYTYFTRGNLAKTESQAITESINDLARRIVERAVEEW